MFWFPVFCLASLVHLLSLENWSTSSAGDEGRTLPAEGWGLPWDVWLLLSIPLPGRFIWSLSLPHPAPEVPVATSVWVLWQLCGRDEVGSQCSPLPTQAPVLLTNDCSAICFQACNIFIVILPSPVLPFLNVFVRNLFIFSIKYSKDTLCEIEISRSLI